MPHFRPRHLRHTLKQLSDFSPLVGVLGHRQVGKTTLLEKVGNKYLTFDDLDTLRLATDNPKHFLSNLKDLGTVLDECQLVEQVFPALKERVRLDRRPGQFYLSGSVRFTSKKLISESLTGRISNVEMIPLTLSEIHQIDLPNSLQKVFSTKSLLHLNFLKPTKAEQKMREELCVKYLIHGGLPGVCFIRNDKVRKQRFQDQLNTLLNRDLRQIYNTTLSLNSLFQFLQTLALYDGQLLNHQAIYRDTRISPSTQKKLLFALESIFVLRQVSVEGDIRGSAYIFEDQGEVNSLSQNRLSSDQQLAGLVYRNLREQTFYHVGFDAQYFQFRTRGGVFVPICIRTPEGIVGVIPCEKSPGRIEFSAARSFLGHYQNSKVVFATVSGNPEALDDRQMVGPLSWLLFE